ncbi:hypothetical protein [Paraburkholderia sp.]|uniref:hypothetical protein n=1 Tax=Paraburkholderia sp. TaxID=1926495 RepID=UPI0039E54E90
MIHLASRANGTPFLFGAALLLCIVDIADAQYFLRDPYAQRHERFATFDERAVRCTCLLHAVIDQIAQFQQHEPLPLNLEDEPLNGMLVPRPPPGAQFGERRRLKGRETHCSDEKYCICIQYRPTFQEKCAAGNGLEKP